jgi:very-short-patch-repair endonuclease
MFIHGVDPNNLPMALRRSGDGGFSLLRRLCVRRVVLLCAPPDGAFAGETAHAVGANEESGMSITDSFGFEKVRHQILNLALGELDRQIAMNNDGKYTQIEWLLEVALCNFCKLYQAGYRLIMLPPEKFDNQDVSNWEAFSTLLYQRQVQIDDWRVDFVVWVFGSKNEKVQWIPLIVECDGHDFHERTKDQAAKDRARDREVQLKGYEIFRFTGSEIWRDPLRCAMQIVDWASERASQ